MLCEYFPFLSLMKVLLTGSNRYTDGDLVYKI